MTRQLGHREVKRTNITLQLTDMFIRYSWGVLENVFVKVDKLIPMHFMVLDMEANVNIPNIFGRYFLATVGTIIDVKNGKFKF